MTTTTEVSDSLERVDSIVNMLDEICDNMDGFSSAEEAWLSSITETLRTWRYWMAAHVGIGRLERTPGALRRYRRRSRLKRQAACRLLY